MTTTHTPGPWAVSAGSYGPEMQINGADGFGVALCADGVGDGVMERNARLIAAAPDLLAALRLALPHVQACAEKDDSLARLNDERGMRGTAAQCRRVAEMRRAAAQVIADAIAKAEGAA